MAEILEARVKQKTGTEADFAGFTLLEGEVALVRSSAGGPVINFKVGPGLYDNLPWSLDYASIAANYKGNATPSTDPGTPPGPEFYTATEAGTYTNFDGIEVEASDAFVLLSYDGVNWSKAVVNIDLSAYLPKSGIDYSPTKNLINKEEIVASRFGLDGEKVISNSALSTPLIPVSETTYTLSGHGPTNLASHRVFFFDEEDTFVSSIAHTGTDDLTFTVPSGASKIGLNIAIETNIGLNPTDNEYSNAVQLEEGDTATSYEPYSPEVSGILGTPIRNAGKELYSKSEVNDLLPSYTTTPVTGKNLANPARINNGLVSSVEDDGVISNPDWRVILISVDEGETYTISGWNTVRTEIAFYSGAIPAPGINPGTTNLISSGNAPSQGLSKSGGVMTFTAPVNCSFFAITIRNNAEPDSVYSALQVEQGVQATAYEPYDEAVVIEEIDSNKLVAGYVKIDGEVVPASRLVTKDELDPGAMTVQLVPDGSSYSSIMYKLGSKTIKQEVAPFRPLLPDVSNVFDFRRTFVDGVLIHTQPDDAAPYRVAGTTIGANHGYRKTMITLADHGKTNEDVGSVWTDGSQEWVIVNIVDSDKLEVSARAANEFYNGSSLTHVSGATHTGAISGGALTNKQMYPAFKNRKLRVFLDEKEISPESKTYSAEKTITFAESYDILDKNSIMEWLITQVGTSEKIVQFDGTAIVTVSISYVFDTSGCCTIYTDFLALEDVAQFQDIMFVMANALDTGATYPVSKVYIPTTLPFTHESVNYDFTQPTDISGVVLSNRIHFTPSRVQPTGIYADRVLMLMDGVGFAVGFFPVKDAEITSRRTNASNKALSISETKKIYMSAIDGLQSSLTKGDYFSVIAYKHYFITDPARTAAYLVKSNAGTYLYADWHTDTVDRIDMPPEVAGKQYTLVEKTDNVSILSEPTSSLMIEVSGITPGTDYAYLILKFLEWE